MRTLIGLCLSTLVSLAFATEGEVAADLAESSQRDFASAFRLLPEINPDAPNWGERFRKEMPSVDSPYYGVNIADVRREHYDKALQNIKEQVQGAEQLFGGRLHFLSATDYGEIRRVIFIIYFEDFPDTANVVEKLRGAGLDIVDPTKFPDIWTGSEHWTEFTRLVDGYTWWIAPALEMNE